MKEYNLIVDDLTGDPVRDLELINGLIALRDSLNDDLRELCELYAIEHHPYKRGDIAPVTGYAHAGKNILIDKVSVKPMKNTVAFFAYGSVINRDGKPGSFEGRWSVEIHHAELSQFIAEVAKKG